MRSLTGTRTRRVAFRSAKAAILHATDSQTDATFAERKATRWRIALIAVCTLVFCSCRGTPAPVGLAGAPSPALPPQAFTGMPPAALYGPQPPMGPPGMEMGVPVPYAPSSSWSPPGLAQPWPADEYLADGGAQSTVGPAPGGQVVGLETEDTVARFDTLDGRSLVQPSNRVNIYSPRFLAVRQVVSLRESDQLDRTSGVYKPERLVHGEDVQLVGSNKQNLQPVGQIGEKSLTIYRTRQGESVMSTAIGPRGFQDAFLPFENFRVIRMGEYLEAEMPFLAKNAKSAVVWERKEAVQVVLEGKVAAALVQDERVEVIYTVKEPPASPKLRVIKVASTQIAEPGEPVDFTIRFDNVGNQPIGNVAILDNLTARLEYVPQSAQSSVQANFSAQPNNAGSLVLRWNITDPVPPGKGGVVRFRCVVR